MDEFIEISVRFYFHIHKITPFRLHHSTEREWSASQKEVSGMIDITAQIEPVSEPERITAEIQKAAAVYERLLTYAIVGCRHLLWKTAFDLNKPELSAAQAQEISYHLQQMAFDLEEYEAEAERLGIGK